MSKNKNEHKLSATQYLAVECLKRSHSNLHQVISRSNTGCNTDVLKRDLARIISELSEALARL